MFLVHILLCKSKQISLIKCNYYLQQSPDHLGSLAPAVVELMLHVKQMKLWDCGHNIEAAELIEKASRDHEVGEIASFILQKVKYKISQIE